MLSAAGLTPAVRGLQAGVTKGAGEMLAGMASPLGLALTLADLGPESALIKRLPELAKAGDRARMVQINGERRVSDEGREGMAAFLEKRRARWVPE